MSKNLKRILMFFAMVLILPLSFYGVQSKWVYYEGNATAGNSNIGMTIDPFNYLLPGFPNTPSGQANNDALQNNIVGGNAGLDNPNSQLNNALKDNLGVSNLPNSNFVTSIDSIPPCKQTGESLRNSISLPSNIHFAIHKSQNGLFTQTWDVYTTDFDINSIKQINGTFTPSNIYPIYKTSYTWKASGLSSNGTYTKNGDTVVGYAPSAINANNNPNKPFFDPTRFKAGNIVLVDSITINGAKDINVGQTLQLSTTILPNTATDKSVIWSSSSPTIADVNTNGLVTAYKMGSANIFAKSSNANIPSAMVTINVKEAPVVLPTNITISGATSCNIGQQVQLTATVTPTDATNKTVTWSVSNNAIATVNNGLVKITGGKNGDKLTVTATTVNNLKATHIITIVENSQQQPNPEWSKPPQPDASGVVTTLPGKTINVGTVDTMYPNSTTNQYVNFTIAPQGSAATVKKVKVTIESSDPNAVIVKANYLTTKGTIAKSTITLDANKKGFQVSGIKSSERRVYFEIKANAPVKVTISYI